MFLRLEIFGHYIEIGKTTEADESPPTTVDSQYPMTIYTEPIGFRIIGDDGVIINDGPLTDSDARQ